MGVRRPRASALSLPFYEAWQGRLREQFRPRNLYFALETPNSFLNRVQLSHVGDIALGNRANLIRQQGGNGYGLAGERHKFNRKARPILMHMHNRPNIASLQAVIRQLLGQHHPIVFFDHCIQSKGWAVIRRGASCPLSNCQTVRTTLSPDVIRLPFIGYPIESSSSLAIATSEARDSKIWNSFEFAFARLNRLTRSVKLFPCGPT